MWCQWLRSRGRAWRDMYRQCLGNAWAPPRLPARSGSASTRSGAGTATGGSAWSRTVPTGASSTSEVERLRGQLGDESLSARNRFRGVVRSVEVDGLLARVEIDVTEPSRVVAIITRESAEALGLEPGASAAGVVKSTSVMVGGEARRRVARRGDGLRRGRRGDRRRAVERGAGDGARGCLPHRRCIRRSTRRRGRPSAARVAAVQRSAPGFPGSTSSFRRAPSTPKGCTPRGSSAARPIRDEQPRADRAEKEPGPDREGGRPGEAADAEARRRGAEGADRPLHARGVEAPLAASGAPQDRESGGGRQGHRGQGRARRGRRGVRVRDGRAAVAGEDQGDPVPGRRPAGRRLRGRRRGESPATSRPPRRS